MEPSCPASLPYQRARFSTHLPTDRLYTPAHYWLRETSPGQYQVGLTKFATRMLGDMVEYEFETKPDAPIALGQPLGWIEAFKAVADIYAALTGTFLAPNPELASHIDAVSEDPYATGYLYTARGTPDPAACDAAAYAALLDATIDKLRQGGV